ncbi:aldo/keto reductase [Psittacicella hinzii]|uniref:2,5-diketo-D-gluconic acid reductase n=1 Tax=Psittacicella hinzii TaxID=2028575 RepID=A0A3A1YIR1_9GAMM|nr:aldo/keto reductase [Psittacicella hinzii]RIY37149.1 2,5-diketo-D-gluconic acid reductase [Psittacicella hinzii]
MENKNIILNNGVAMPKVGLGVYKMVEESECIAAVLAALEAGYRHIDTASYYFNEKAVGKAIKMSGIPREELFITTKLWVNDTNEALAPKAFKQSLDNLGLDYLDLYLVHQPFNDVFGAWRALEKLYANGDVRAIGVSNFFPDILQNLILFNNVVPAVNQIELHPFNQQNQAHAFHQEQGIVTESWASFARGRNDMFSNPVLLEIASQTGKTVGQVILRWLLQRDIAVIPKSVTPSRIQENISIFDFSLSDEQMQLISQLNEDLILFHDERQPEVIRSICSRL